MLNLILNKILMYLEKILIFLLKYEEILLKYDLQIFILNKFLKSENI